MTSKKLWLEKRFCQSLRLVYSITTRNSHTLLFVFTSSSSHPDRCQKTLVFFFKKPHIFPIRKDRFAALSYSSLQEEDSKKKKVKMVLVVVAKMVPKMNRWGESYWHFFSLLLTTNSQKDRLLVHSQLFFHQYLKEMGLCISQICTVRKKNLI